jgi:hypothetical protein
MSTETNTPDPAAPPRKLATVKIYCRCGQKVRINLPAPKPTGRCPKCGHDFVLPQVPLEYQGPGKSSAPTSAPTPVPTPAPAPAATSAQTAASGEARGQAG